MIRRHTKGEKEIHFQPALTVVSGNYVTAKRRGIVDGTDFGLTGEVGLGVQWQWLHWQPGGCPRLPFRVQRMSPLASPISSRPSFAFSHPDLA